MRGEGLLATWACVLSVTIEDSWTAHGMCSDFRILEAATRNVSEQATV